MNEFTEDDAAVLDDTVMWVRAKPSSPWHLIDCVQGPSHREACAHRRLREGPPPKGDRMHYQCVFGPQWSDEKRKAARAAGLKRQDQGELT